MKKIPLKFLFTLLIIAFASSFSNTQAEQKANFNIFPTQGEYKVGEKINLTISVNPNGNNYDTIFTNLKFPSDLLELQNFKFGEQYSVQSPDNTFDNSTGIMLHSAGIPGGSNANSIFGTASFLVKKNGEATITLNPESEILSSGEVILSGQSLKTNFTLVNPSPPPPPPQKTHIIENNEPVKNITTPQKLETPVIQPQNETASILSATIPIIENLSSNSKKSMNYFDILKWAIPLLLIILAGIYVFTKKNKSKKQKNIIISALIFLSLASYQNIHANEIPLVSVEPSKININLNSNEKILKSLLVVNKSDKLVTLKVSVKDYKVINEEGKIDFYYAEFNSAVKWLIPQYISMQIKPYDAQKLEFIAIADKNMPGGGYNGAIIFQLYNNDAPIGESFGTLIDMNTINQGITTGATIKGFSMPKIQFTEPAILSFKMNNLSNSNFSSTGNIILTDIFSKKTSQFDAGQLDLYPGSTRDFKFQWNNENLFGIYKADVNLTNQIRDDNKLQYSSWLVFLPIRKMVLPTLITLLLSIIAIIIAYKFIRNQKNKKILFIKNNLLDN